MPRLAGKVALISGAASGIGAAHARIFAQHGAKVVVGDIQETMGRTTVDEVNKAGGSACFVPLDVTSEEGWRTAVAAAIARFGGLTTLVNNAGIHRPSGVQDETLEGWNRLIAVNQLGVWLGMKAALPALLECGNASIVNISSLYGLVGRPDSIAYHASKGAVRLMTKSAALEFARRGVRINSIHPGVIATPMGANTPQEFMNAFAATVPLGRIGNADEIAYGSLYLCSDEAAYVTGIELTIDGGCSAG